MTPTTGAKSMRLLHRECRECRSQHKSVSVLSCLANTSQPLFTFLSLYMYLYIYMYMYMSMFMYIYIYMHIGAGFASSAVVFRSHDSGDGVNDRCMNQQKTRPRTQQHALSRGPASLQAHPPAHSCARPRAYVMCPVPSHVQARAGPAACERPS